ncbi:hypothetical protein L208DRAFT_1526506 [Tricholoma matsutake]|nr:hypothetical protein L208DRAFT_1526506 [Tricholoma matsutake 945]
MVPQPQDMIMEFIISRAVSLTMGRMLPFLSIHKNSGSPGPAGTMFARFLRASSGQSPCCSTRYTDCISPADAIFTDGRSSHAYSLLFRSQSKTTSAHFRCFAPLKLALDWTETSPNLIIPQYAHDAMAQMQASNGSFRFRDDLSMCSIWDHEWWSKWSFSVAKDVPEASE